jgi:hypothetical protein
LSPAEHQPRVTREVQQQVEFTRSQIDRFLPNRDFPAGGINFY